MSEQYVLRRRTDAEIFLLVVFFLLAGAFSSSALAQSLSSVSLSPATVVGGNPSTGTVTLSGNAPTGGKVVTLSSSNTAAATVPASVTVPAGVKTATFSVTTLGVSANTSVTVSGTLSGTTKTASLTVNKAALTTTALSPSTHVGGYGNTSTGTVTLTGKAPTGGAVVSLTSGNTAAVVPASVTIPAQQVSATFSITTSSVTANTNITISGTYSSVTKSATLTVQPLLASLALSQSTVSGGKGIMGTVRLTAAVSSDTVVTLTSSLTAAATVPASITIPAGSLTGTFTVTSLSVTSNKSVTITAAQGGVSKTASLTVTPGVAMDQVTLSVPSVKGGGSTSGTVYLNAAATSASTVTLSSSDASATVPASVTVPVGSSTATFTITTVSVTSNKTATITASFGGVSKTASLSVTSAVEIQSVSVSPVSLVTGTATGTVTLNGNVSSSASVTLTSSATDTVTVPASVTVSSGQSSATFTVTAVAGSTNRTATVTAKYPSTVSRTAAVSVTGAAAPMTVTLSPASLLSGGTSTGTVTLNGSAPAGGLTVTLRVSDSIATLSAGTLTVPSGQTAGTFTVNTSAVTIESGVIVSGGANGVWAEATLNLLPVASLSSISLSPVSIRGGGSVTGTVTLTSAAPSGGATVTLASSNTAAATVPASVAVAQGQTSATFTVASLPVSASTGVTITGTYATVSKTATLTVTPAVLTNLTVAPSTIPGGGTATATLTLDGPAGPGGTAVSLTSSNTAVATVPASTVIAAGQMSGTFTVTGTSLPAGGTSTISATLAGVTKTANVTLQASAALQSVTLSASTIRGGQPVSGTVTLTLAAPSGGVTVTLTSSQTSAATVPASVSVAQGQTSASFSVTTLAVSASASVTITGVYSGVSKTAALTVTPAVLTNLAIAPSTIPGGGTATGTLTLDGPAGPGGVTVSLTSSDTNVATVPASTVVAAGQTAGTFTVTGAAVVSDGTATITATLAGATRSADITVTRTIGTLSGAVKDASTGFTLPNAHVVLTGDAGRETWTDGTGQYQLTDVPAGTHTVEVSYEQYSSVTSSPVTVTNGQIAVIPAVSLTPNPVTVFGTVSDEGNGYQPLSGVLVTDATGLHTATTDGNGSYTLTGLASGFTQVVFYRPGYRPTATGELDLNPGQNREASAGLSPGWVEDKTGTAEGVVRDAAGNPVSGVTVSAVGVSGVTAVTGADGKYVLTLPAGIWYVLQAEKTGYRRVFSRTLRASAGNRAYHIMQDFTLPAVSAMGTVELRTFDPVSRTPFRSDLWFRTPGGLYHAPVPDSGTRSVTGISAGPVWDCLGMRYLPAGGTLTVRCTGEPVVPQGTPRWAAGGMVVNRYAAEPVPGATVTFVNGATTVPVTTDSNGLFSYQSGPLGEYSVKAAATGYFETDPWVFTATDNPDNGNFYGAVLWPDQPAGSVSITSPAEGATLTTPLTQVAVSLSPERFGDNLLLAWASLSRGDVTSITPVYAADGKSAVIAINASILNGPLTVYVEAITASGTQLLAERNVTLAVPPAATEVTLEPASTVGGQSVTGRVTVYPQAPAGGQTVALTSSNPLVASVPSTVTVPAGELSVSFWVATSPVAVSSNVTVSATAGGVTKSASLTVLPPNPVTAFGTVYDEGNGNQPLAGVLVTDATGLHTATTDGNGTYTLTGLTPGFTQLTFYKSGYRPTATSELDVNLDQPREASLGLSPVWAEDQPGKAEGVVRDSAGNPVSGATVSAVGVSGVSAVSGTDGKYILTLPAGIWYVLQAEKTGYMRVFSRTLRASAGNRAYHITQDFTLPVVSATGTVELRTFDPVSRTPFRSDLWFRTPAGVYRVLVPDTGSWTVSGVPAGPVWDCLGVRYLPAGGTLTVRCTGEPVVPQGTPRWAAGGMVVNRYAAEPVPGATVTFVNGATTVPVTTDVNGLFSYKSGPLGEYSVKAAATGYLETDPWVFTAEDNPDNGNFYGAVLWPDQPGGSVSITSPAEGVTLTTPLTQVAVSFSPERSGDNLLLVWASISAGNITSITPVYAADGKSAVIGINGTTPNGPLTVSVEAVTASGTPLTVERHVTMALPVVPDSVHFEQASVSGSVSTVGWVTLNRPAQAGGLSVSLLSSSPGIAAVPASVTVPEGQTQASFVVTTFPVAVAANVTVSATAGGVTKSEVLTVLPPSLTGLSLNRSSVYAFETVTGTATLSSPAPAEGTVVTLSSSDPLAVTLPASVTVAAGQTTAAFMVTALAVPAVTPVTVSATLSGVTKTAGLTINPVIMSSFTLSGSSLCSGQVATGTVTLNTAAPAGGVSVALSSSDPLAATVPSSVTVAAGATSVTFQAAALAISTDTTVTVTATLAGVTKTAAVTVKALLLTALSVPALAVENRSYTCSVSLNGKAGAGGVTVQLTSSDPAVFPVPATVTVPAGSTSQSFSVTAGATASDVTVTLTAVAGSVTKTATTAVQPFGVATVAFSDAQITPGDFTSATVTLNGNAPAGGTVVTLTCTTCVFVMYGQAGTYFDTGTSVTIPEGSNSKSGISVFIPWSGSAGTAGINATNGRRSASVSKPYPAGSFTVTAEPAQVKRGGTANLIMRFLPGCSPWVPTLSGVGLTSSNPQVLSVPAQTNAINNDTAINCSATFKVAIPVLSTAYSGTANVSVAYEGVSASVVVTVTDPALSGFTVTPPSALAGATVTGTVQLDSPAPPGGTIVSLSSSNTSVVQVPPTVLVGAGQQTATVPVTAQTVPAATSAVVTASYGGVSKTASVQVMGPGAATITGMIADAGKYDLDTPLEGVLVSVENGPSSMVTDSTGIFTVYADSGTTRVSFSKTNFVTGQSDTLNLAPSQVLSLGTIKLKRQFAGACTVTGKVYEPTSPRTPVTGATGMVEGYEGALTTNAQGQYTFTAPLEARYRLTFSKSGYPTRTLDIRPLLIGPSCGVDMREFLLDTVPRSVLDGVWFTYSPVSYPNNASFQLRLTGEVPPEGAEVWFTFDNPAAVQTFDRTVVAAGSTLSWMYFPVTTKNVTSPQTVNMTAAYGGVTKRATVVINPTGGTLSTLTVSPAAVTGGQSASGTVTIASAIATDTVVNLASSDPAVTVPATVLVLAGQTTANFAITTSLVTATKTVTITASGNGMKTATLTVNSPVSARILGLAPGVAISDQGGMVLYGQDFQPGETAFLVGPIYAYGDYTTPLCSQSNGTCPIYWVDSSVNAAGTQVSFMVPASMTPGTYWVQSRSASTVLSQSGVWFLIEPTQKTRPALTVDEHRMAMRIWPGQTVQGRLEGNVPSGGLWDYNFYYFHAAAGSRITVTLDRVDTSLGWENPESLDPYLGVIAPDGFVYSNLTGDDVEPGVNLNAKITNALLPQTGMYVISAGTARGRGDYRLKLTLESEGTAAPAERVFAIAGQGNLEMRGLNTTVPATAIALDARGYPLSGALLDFAVVTDPGNRGSFTFPRGTAAATSPDGSVVNSVFLTGAGKVQFKASLHEAVLATAAFEGAPEAAKNSSALTGDSPRPGEGLPVARLHGRPAMGKDGTVWFSESRITRFRPEELPLRAEGKEKPARRIVPRGTRGLLENTHSVNATSCYPATFTLQAVNPAPQPPYTIKLTDLTPATGQSQPNGEITDLKGVFGHRVEKEIRLKVEITDAQGNTPSHPVLVAMRVDGPHKGTLIADPAGERRECTELVFLWHDRDAQGNLIPNEEVGYKLGTRSWIESFENDAVSPGGHKPIWGASEALSAEVWSVDSGGLIQIANRDIGVHVEPGKPDHLAAYDLSGNLIPSVFKYWNGYLVARTGPAGILTTDWYYYWDVYTLFDKFENVVYGYTSTGATPPALNVQVEFKDQTQGGPQYQSYLLKTAWKEDPSLPVGSMTAVLSVNYPSDPDWAAGTVLKTITYLFEGGQTRVLARHKTYDAIRPDGTAGVDDGAFGLANPNRVKPGAMGALLPKTSAGDGRRLVLLAYLGDKVWGTLPQPEPISTGSRVWTQQGATWFVSKTEPEPRLSLSESPSFNLRAVDDNWNEVEDLEFRVHRCPRFDHEPQRGVPCTLTPVSSTSGKVLGLTVNPNGGGDGNRGYMGIELTRAPMQPGIYYILVESVNKTYRIRRQSDYATEVLTDDDEYRGAFAIATVDERDCVDGRCHPLPCGKCTGSPNFIGTGLYTATATDMVLSTAGFPITVSRRYLSAPNIDGTAGKGWVSSVESRVYYTQMSTGKAINVMLPEGVPLMFKKDMVTGNFVPVAGRKDILIQKPDGSYELQLEKSRTVYRYAKNGPLQSMTDEYGNTLTYSYGANGQLARISDGTGRFVDVIWGSNNRISTLRDHGNRTVIYSYDGQGLLTTVTDPAGRMTRYEYQAGTYGPLLKRIADHWNRTLSVITYDEVDRTKTYTEHGETYTYQYVDAATVTKTDTQGNQWTYTVGDGGLITSRTPQGNAGTQTSYNADGSIASTVDEAGVATNYSYDSNGQVASVTRDALGTPVNYTYQYDPAFPEKVTSVAASDANWQSWKYEYYQTGSPAPGSLKSVKRVRTDGTTIDTLTTYAYDGSGRISSQTAASGAATNYTYDGRGNLSTVTGPSNNAGGTRPATAYSYDTFDRVNAVTDPNSKTTNYTYDALGRILTVTLPKPSPSSTLNFTTAYSYDNFDSGTGLVFTQITDPNGRVTKLGYDEFGRLLKSIDANNQATMYAYTRSLLTSITDANGNVTSYLYDSLKRLAKTTFPDGKEETYTYQPDGLLKTKTDRRGITVTYGYDAHKRLITKTYSTGGSIGYTYQGQKLTQVADTTVTPNETHTFGYDDRYRMTSTAEGPRGTVNYTYGADDRVATMGIQSGPTATYGYFDDGSLKQVQWSPVSGTFGYTYTANGQYNELTFPNGQKRTYTYDDQGRLTQLSNSLNSTTLASFGYGYDVNQATGLPGQLGQRTSLTVTLPHQSITNGEERFFYDPLYQLNKVVYPNVAPFNAETDEWTYDSIGNRLTNTVNGTAQSYSYLKNGTNPNNGQKLANDGANAYTYDFNGNTLTRGGTTFAYDYENRLKTISGSDSATYTYDYQGRRTSKTVGGVTTAYLYDGLNLIAETTNGVTSYFLSGPAIDEPLAMSKAGAVWYFSVDGLGSVVATNDPAGTVSHSVVFDAWGNTKSELGTRIHPFTYTGREVGEAGTLFYRARYYTPTTGRFTQEDPLRFYQGEHPFLFVANTPAVLVDPTGLFPEVPATGTLGCRSYLCESAVLKAISEAYKLAFRANFGNARSASTQIEAGFWIMPNPGRPYIVGGMVKGDRNGRLKQTIPLNGAIFHTHMTGSGMPSTTQDNVMGTGDRGDTKVAHDYKTDVYVISSHGLSVAPSSTMDPASGKESLFIVKGNGFDDWYQRLLKICEDAANPMPEQ